MSKVLGPGPKWFESKPKAKAPSNGQADMKPLSVWPAIDSIRAQLEQLKQRMSSWEGEAVAPETLAQRLDELEDLQVGMPLPEDDSAKVEVLIQKHKESVANDFQKLRTTLELAIGYDPAANGTIMQRLKQIDKDLGAGYHPQSVKERLTLLEQKETEHAIKTFHCSLCSYTLLTFSGAVTGTSCSTITLCPSCGGSVHWFLG